MRRILRPTGYPGPAGFLWAALLALGALVGCDGQDDDVSTPTNPTSGASDTSDVALPPDDEPATSTSGASTTSEVAQAPDVYRSSTEPVTAEDLGASWTDGIGCTPPDELAAVSVSHHGSDGGVHQGRIIVAAEVADAVVSIFADLFDAGFPIERMEPVSVFGGDDDASMRANNTSGYNCRTVAGTDRLSQHALGLAIDINPLVNPWVHDGIVDPPEGADYADRSRTDGGIIHAGDAVVEAFAAHGWSWGGYWDEPDYQHFSTTGR